MIFDVVSVGHFSIDSILLPSRSTPITILGGSVAYVSLAARRLDARVAVISKVGANFPEAYKWWLEQEGIDLSGVSKSDEALTTRFELEYSGDLSERTLRLKDKAPSINVQELPQSLKAGVVHLAPINGEVSYEVAQQLRSQADTLSLDPQGLVRAFDQDGKVTQCSLEDKRILGLVDIFKSSLSEIKAVTDLPDLESAIKGVHDCGVKIVIVTLGMKGAVVSTGQTVHNIPACNSEKLVDPTGVGDAFAGGFLAEYARGANILRCACVGSAAASLVLEGVGPTFFGDKEQIYRRARELYEKEIKE